MKPLASEAVSGWARLFRDVGFPALVAAFVLWRLDGAVGRLEARTGEIVRLLEAVHAQRCERRARGSAVDDESGVESGSSSTVAPPRPRSGAAVGPGGRPGARGG